MKRSGFFQAAAGGAIATFGFLYPGAAGAVNRVRRSGSPTVVPDPAGPDPTYAGGEVASISKEGVVLQTVTTARAVRLPAETAVWKEFMLTPDVIELGDWLDVKGEPQLDGSLLATSGMVFVNIGRKDGALEAVAPGSLQIRNEQGVHDVELSPAVEFIRGDDGSALAKGLQDIQLGAHIGAVGLRLPNRGFRATRVWTVQ